MIVNFFPHRGLSKLQDIWMCVYEHLTEIPFFEWKFIIFQMTSIKAIELLDRLSTPLCHQTIFI